MVELIFCVDMKVAFFMMMVIRTHKTLRQTYRLMNFFQKCAQGYEVKLQMCIYLMKMALYTKTMK